MVSVYSTLRLVMQTCHDVWTGNSLYLYKEIVIIILQGEYRHEGTADVAHNTIQSIAINSIFLTQAYDITRWIF